MGAAARAQAVRRWDRRLLAARFCAVVEGAARRRPGRRSAPAHCAWPSCTLSPRRGPTCRSWQRSGTRCRRGSGCGRCCCIPASARTARCSATHLARLAPARRYRAGGPRAAATPPPAARRLARAPARSRAARRPAWVVAGVAIVDSSRRRGAGRRGRFLDMPALARLRGQERRGGDPDTPEELDRRAIDAGSPPCSGPPAEAGAARRCSTSAGECPRHPRHQAAAPAAPAGPRRAAACLHAAGAAADAVVVAKDRLDADFGIPDRTVAVRNCGLPASVVPRRHGPEQLRLVAHAGALGRARGWPQMLDALALLAAPAQRSASSAAPRRLGRGIHRPRRDAGRSSAPGRATALAAARRARRVATDSGLVLCQVK